MSANLISFILAFNFVFICSIVNIEAKCESNSSISVKTYVINLDLPPRERFKQVVNDYKYYIWEWYSAKKYSFFLVI